MSKENKKILDGAGPFYYEGNKVGILMIHGGGGGTCADLKPLAEEIYREGEYTIHVPLLPGYGTSPEDLRTTPISAWKDAIDNYIKSLKEKCETIIVGGHSMGGLLTLISTTKHNLDGIFTISSPIGIQGILLKLVPLFKIFIKYHSINSEQFRRDTNGKWVGYNKMPINIAPKFKKLINEMKESLPYVKCPALLFQGRLDSVIDQKSMDYIYESINSKRKRKIWLENNDHPILDSPDHNQIVSELLKFVTEICT